jgi:hypothetical protein
MQKATSATMLNDFNWRGSYFRTPAGLPQNLRKSGAEVLRRLRRSVWKSNDFNGRGGSRKCGSLLPRPLISMDLFAAAEFPHTPCAHFRALEGRAKRRVHLMGGVR